MFYFSIPNYLAFMSSTINEARSVLSLENSCFENDSIQISKNIICFPNFFSKLNSSSCLFIKESPMFRREYSVLWPCISLNASCKTPGRVISCNHILNINIEHNQISLTSSPLTSIISL